MRTIIIMKQIGKEIQINNQGRETLDKKKKTYCLSAFCSISFFAFVSPVHLSVFGFRLLSRRELIVS